MKQKKATRAKIASPKAASPKTARGERVFILGGGKVGRALHHACREAGLDVTLRPHRRGLPKKPLAATFVILAVRDRELGPLAEALGAARLVPKDAVCVHVAGALDASPLAPLRAVCAGVAQMHPMISFASTTFFPTLARGNVHLQGDAVAVKRAATFARRLGMSPRTFPKLDPVGYHSAAALTANGAVALAAAARELLQACGVPEPACAAMLGPLLRSVAENIETLGFPEALTGPIRRGDPASIAKQLDVLAARVPGLLPFFVEACSWQIPLAAQLGEVPEENLSQIKVLLAKQRAAGPRLEKPAPPSTRARPTSTSK